jgi:hypothetical protein
MGDSRIHPDSNKARRLAFFDRVKAIDIAMGVPVDPAELEIAEQWDLLCSGVRDARIRDTCMAVFMDL